MITVTSSGMFKNRFDYPNQLKISTQLKKRNTFGLNGKLVLNAIK